MFTHTQPEFGLGRRVRSDLFPDKIGTIVMVRPASPRDPQPSYDIAWADATGLDRVSQNLLKSSAWRLLEGALPREQVERLRYDFMAWKISQRTEAAEQRLRERGGRDAQIAEPALFYRPSEALERAGRANVSPGQAKEVSKALRQELHEAFPWIPFKVLTKGDSVEITWPDGPVSIQGVVEKYQSNRPGQVPQAARIVARRDITDLMIECAIEFVRHVRGEKFDGVDAAAFRRDGLRHIYPKEHFGVSLGTLVRLVLLRWDDFERRFTGVGMTRGMVLENRLLFQEGGLEDSSALMRTIRDHWMHYAQELLQTHSNDVYGNKERES